MIGRGFAVACAALASSGAGAAGETVATCERLSTATVAAARIPGDVWRSFPTFSVLVRFRVESDGVPADVEAVKTTVGSSAGAVADESSLALAAADAVSRSRFCVAEHHDRWSPARVVVRFVAVPTQSAYVQELEPSYSHGDFVERREGHTVGSVSFDVSGIPQDVAIVTTSGDEVLDAKTLATLRNARLIVPADRALERPLKFQQPFDYVIR